MTDPPPLQALVPRFLDLIQGRSPVAAAGFAAAQLQQGFRPEEVITDLLAPAQAEVGRRWHEALWTAADEHQATAVTDAALYAVTADAVRPRTSRGTVAVVCASGDWHTLPSRMAAELLRLDGWDVLFLGGSLPADHLTRWLGDARPDCLVVSCSMPTTAHGIADTAAAAAEVGVAVVAGGRGMGTDDRRAVALGVRWATDLTSLAAALDAPAPEIDRDDLACRLLEHSNMQLHRADIVGDAIDELGRRWPAMSGLSGWQMSRTREDFGYILDALGAAMATSDPRVFGEFSDWLQLLLSARRLPASVVGVSCAAIAAVLPPGLALTQRILAEALDRSPAEVR